MPVAEAECFGLTNQIHWLATWISVMKSMSFAMDVGTVHKMAVDIFPIYDETSEAYPFLGWGFEVYKIQSGGDVLYSTRDHLGNWFSDKEHRRTESLKKLIELTQK